MTDYSKMSDFEIDKAVADAIGFEYDLAVMFVSPVDKVNGNHVEEYVRKKITNNERHWKRFSPTRSWADAGPIIASRNITIINSPGQIPIATTDYYAMAYEDYESCLFYSHTNILRAAMIVFLMMNEGE